MRLIRRDPTAYSAVRDGDLKLIETYADGRIEGVGGEVAARLVTPLATRFGIVLRRRREAAGLSQEALAAEAGLQSNFVSLLERGRGCGRTGGTFFRTSSPSPQDWPTGEAVWPPVGAGGAAPGWPPGTV